MGRRSEYTFLQRRHTNDRQAHERMSTSLTTREMKAKATMCITSHLLEGLLSKRQKTASVGEDEEEKEQLYIVGGKANHCSHYKKQYRDGSKN